MGTNVTLIERLMGMSLPDITLQGPEEDVRLLRLAKMAAERVVLFLFPGDGTQPDAAIAPAALGRSGNRPFGNRPRANDPSRSSQPPTSCAVHRAGFREYALDFAAHGSRVVGVSCEPAEIQASIIQAERLPFPLLGDRDFRLATALGLPTFDDIGVRRYRRLTLICNQSGAIEAAFYPVSPKRSASQALAWLQRFASY